MITKLASSASSARKTPTRKKASVDLVIPVFNEEAVIGVFHERLGKALKPLPYQFKVIYVNDGSTDRTQSRLQEIAKKDKRVEVIEFSRNFGHQAALTAGLDRANPILSSPWMATGSTPGADRADVGNG